MSRSVRWLAALSLVGMLLACGPAFAQRRGRPVPPPSPRQPGYAPSVFGPQFNANPLVAPGLTLQQATYNAGVVGGTQAQLLRSVGLTGPNLSRVLAAQALAAGVRPYFGPVGGFVAPPPVGYAGGSALYSAPWGLPYGGYFPATPSLYTSGGNGYPFPDQGSTLRSAPKDAPKSEIWSGQALNAALHSITRSGNLNRGPNIPLSHDTLKHLNLTDGGSKGSAGMLQKIDKQKWPQSLQESKFDKARMRLTRNLRRAVNLLKDKESLVRAEVQDVNSDFEALNTTLSDNADDMAPSQYIEAKHFLNRLKLAIAFLSEREAVKQINNTWNAKGENVAELLSYMIKEGLEFAPAAEGDEAAYTALYQALRTFEAGVQSASR